MAVPTIVSSATTQATDNGSTSTAVVNLPASYSADDLLVIVLHSSSDSDEFSAPSGWAAVPNCQLSMVGGVGESFVFRKKASGSEGSTVNVPNNTTYWNIAAVAFAVNGAEDPAVQEIVGDVDYSTGSTSLVCPAVTAAANDSLVIRFASSNENITLTKPTSPASTLIALAVNTGNNDRVSVAYEDSGVAAGSTGTANYTASASWPKFLHGTLAISPPSAVAPTISSVTLTGTSQIGQTLTATVVTDQDPVDSTTYQWQKANTDSEVTGTDLSGTSQTLALTYSDFADLLDADADSVYVRCQAIATVDSQASDEDASDWQLVSIPSEVSAGGGSLLESSLIR